jgi:hypothetical protein
MGKFSPATPRKQVQINGDSPALPLKRRLKSADSILVDTQFFLCIVATRET